MNKMQWFRLYHDLPGDKKLRRFSSQQKWAWVCLLCLASESAERGIVKIEDDEDIADFCGFDSTQDYQYFLDKLRQKNMVEPVPGGLKIVHWLDRQYDKPSDRPEATKERKRRSRSNKKNQANTESRSSHAKSLDGHTTEEKRGEEKRRDQSREEEILDPRSHTETLTAQDAEKAEQPFVSVAAAPKREFESSTAKCEARFANPHRLETPWEGSADYEKFCEWLGKQYNHTAQWASSYLRNARRNPEQNESACEAFRRFHKRAPSEGTKEERIQRQIEEIEALRQAEGAEL